MDYPRMMQPIHPLSQLAWCCGFGSGGSNRRGMRSSDFQRNYFYSPSTAHFQNPGNGWGANTFIAANPYMSPNHQQQQPYLLFTQPVIITANPATNQTNTMTLVQHAQTVPPNSTNIPQLSILGGPTTTVAASHQATTIQPNIVSSQYAIYGTSSTALNSGHILVSNSRQQQAKPAIFESRHDFREVDSQQNYSVDKSPVPLMEQSSIIQQQRTPIQIQQQQQFQYQQQRPRAVTLSTEIFRQLEVIEKQVDLTRDMDLIEHHGIVITRALDPYSLMPHLTEATLRRYENRFLFSDDYVIRFIEIIKRPGQTLGLYIRTVQFEDPQTRSSRAGLVVTKIDSDSPIYNSQVLHVGDEILSVNLVDIQGMNLDDVVIIMSIPKRLVLALRIPRDRDIVPQVMTTSNIGPETMDGTTIPMAPRSNIINPSSPLGTVKQPVISNIRLGDTPEQSSYFSSSIDAINRELKELRRQRMALCNNEQNIVDSSNRVPQDDAVGSYQFDKGTISDKYSNYQKFINNDT